MRNRFVESYPAWPLHARWSESSVETIALSGGIKLILSRMDEGGHFQLIEPEDVFGIGFHLRGGARFDMDGHTFETQALDVWAGTAPRGSLSVFQLPQHGFHTASLRFTPNGIRELLDRYEYPAGAPLDAMARTVASDISMARLAHLDAATARLIHLMFETPYTGAARSLYLESCALGLLAALIDATMRQCSSQRELAENRLMADARAWLDHHLDSPPSILELARIVGSNEFKLKRGFKARFGTTIFGYVRQRRMERAAAHLRAGLSVARAAESVGYTCPRSFADAFRRHFGLLPSEYTSAVMTETPAPHS